MKFVFRSIAVAASISSLVAASPMAMADCGNLDLQAHRGAPGLPENSLGAVTAALNDPNYGGVEIDVQLLRDGYWVLHHDLTTGRMVQGVGVRQVSQLESGHWHGATLAGTNRRPSFLGEVLEAFKSNRQDHQRLNIEIKGNFACAAVSQLDSELSGFLTPGSWIYSTPSQSVAECLAQSNPKAYIGLVIAPEDDSLEEKHGGLADAARGLGKRFGLDTSALEQKARDTYRRVSGLEALSDPAARSRLASMLAGRGGVHIDVRTLENNLAAVADLQSKGLSLYTYGATGDAAHAAALQRVRAQNLTVNGAIIDEEPAAFCSRL